MAVVGGGDDRECGRCGRPFRFPRDLRVHEARKTPCDPIVDPGARPPEARDDPELEDKTCRFCGRVYASPASMRRHVRDNCRIAPTEKNGGAGMELLYQHTARRQQARIEALEAQVVAMADQMTAGKASAGAGGVAVVGDNARVDNRKIIINIHGREDLSHIGAPQIKQMLDAALRSGSVEAAARTVVAETAMLVYSDPDHPENQTCFIPNKKVDNALVHAEHGWELQPLQGVSRRMASTALDTIFDHQPSADNYAPVMREITTRESDAATEKAMQPALTSNKSKLKRVMGRVPRPGDGKEED